MERHYCYSCRDWHGFLTEAEWAEVEPLWREGQRAAAQAGRIARRLRRPIGGQEWRSFYARALAKHAAVTGDPVENPHNLYHRQLRHDCKWRPRVDDPPPPDPGVAL